MKQGNRTDSDKTEYRLKEDIEKLHEDMFNLCNEVFSRSEKIEDNIEKEMNAVLLTYYKMEYERIMLKNKAAYNRECGLLSAEIAQLTPRRRCWFFWRKRTNRAQDIVDGSACLTADKIHTIAEAELSKRAEELEELRARLFSTAEDTMDERTEEVRTTATRTTRETQLKGQMSIEEVTKRDGA